MPTRLPAWAFRMNTDRAVRLRDFRLTAAEMAAIFDVTEETIRVWCRTGKRGVLLPYTEVGRSWGFRVEDMLEFSRAARVSWRLDQIPASILKDYADLLY